MISVAGRAAEKGLRRSAVPTLRMTAPSIVAEDDPDATEPFDSTEIPSRTCLPAAVDRHVRRRDDAVLPIRVAVVGHDRPPRSSR